MNKGQSVSPGSPTDLELMQYFDGELEEPRRSAVAAFLSADQGGRSKVAGLGITSAILRNEASSLSAADDIADLVMAKIAAEPAPTTATPMQSAAASAKVVSLPVLATKAAAPANDNSRRIFAALGALAVAAAAALALWARPGAAPIEPVRSSPVAAVTVPSTLPTPAATEANLADGAAGRASAPSAPNPEIDAASVNAEPDPEHGVEVAAVNFGAHMGSIFYVPSGSIEAKRTTTVVWLADDAGE